MNLVLRSVFSIVAFLLLCTPSVFAQAPSIEEIVQGWKDWVLSIDNDGTRWEFERHLKGVEYSRLVISGEGRLVTESSAITPGEASSAFILNPNYSASVEKSPEGEWFLKRLSLPDEEQYKAALGSLHDWKEGLFVSSQYMEIPLDDAYSTIIRFEEKMIQCVKNDDAPKDQRPNSVEFKLSESAPFVPVDILAVSEGFGQKIERHAEIDWNPYGSKVVPTKYHYEIRKSGFPSGNGTSKVEAWSKIRVGNADEDDARFTLGAYGLPEPAGLSEPAWWPWIVAGAAVGIVGFLLVRKGRESA